MLIENMYNSSRDYPLGGGYTTTTPSSSQTLNENSSTIFGSACGRPYDYTFFPAYYSPRPFDDINAATVGLKSYFGSTSPTYQYNGSQTQSPPSSPTAELSSIPPFYASLSKIGEFYGTSPAGETQRTTSVIMKVERHKVVEFNAKDFSGRTSSDSEDEISICKWENCYR